MAASGRCIRRAEASQMDAAPEEPFGEYGSLLARRRTANGDEAPILPDVVDSRALEERANRRSRVSHDLDPGVSHGHAFDGNVRGVAQVPCGGVRSGALRNRDADWIRVWKLPRLRTPVSLDC